MRTGHATFLALAIVAFALASSGCRSTGKHILAYEGPPRATNEVVLLMAQRGSFWALVEKIDDSPINKTGKRIFNDTTEIELLPGSHSVEVGYYDVTKARSVENAKLTFICQLGHEYKLCVAPLHQSFGPFLKRMVIGGRFQWTAWIVDAQTGEVITGGPPPEDLRWYEN